MQRKLYVHYEKMLTTTYGVRGVLKSDAVVPAFQPLIELSSGSLQGFEVLARCRNRTGELILPGNFISLAEQSGLIDVLTEQVLRKAFIAAAGWPQNLAIAVNISPIQLKDRNLPNRIRDIAEAANFALSRLVIEITETAIIDNLDAAQSIAIELKEMGCRLALDDFGTGYSSLLHLQALPFDKLKIDRSFVQAMTTKRESRKIVAAVIGLGQNLGLTTVAEGVETEEQAAMLLGLGCQLGQGWLFGRPTSAEAIPAILAASSRALLVIDEKLSRASLGLESLPSRQLAQLRAIYDGAPVGLCFLDANMRYVSINRQLAEMNGHSVVAHLGKTVAQIIPDVFPIVGQYIRRALAGEQVSGIEITRRNYQLDGQLLTFLCSYVPALDEVGEITGVSVSAVDITSRKQAEEELRTSREFLKFLPEPTHARAG